MIHVPPFTLLFSAFAYLGTILSYLAQKRNQNVDFPNRSILSVTNIVIVAQDSSPRFPFSPLGLPYSFPSIAIQCPTPHNVIRMTPSLHFQSGHLITKAQLYCVQARFFPRHRSGSTWQDLVLLPVDEQRKRVAPLFSITVRISNRHEHHLTPRPSQELSEPFIGASTVMTTYHTSVKTVSTCATFFSDSTLPTRGYVAWYPLFCFHVFLWCRSFKVKGNMSFEDI